VLLTIHGDCSLQWHDTVNEWLKQWMVKDATKATAPSNRFFRLQIKRLPPGRRFICTVRSLSCRILMHSSSWFHACCKSSVKHALR